MGADEAWAVAHEAARAAGVALRPLSTAQDLQGVARVIDAVWGPDAMPPALLRAFEHAGGVLVGAFDGRDQIGFVLGFLGWEDGLHLHSHMLAVLPDRQSRGIGRALKLAQRAACLDRGVREIRWTYDPLLAGNARFNLNLLGAVATSFHRDFYGPMPDRLNRGERSDRFEVRWDLESGRAGPPLQDTIVIGLPGLPSILEAVGNADAPEPIATDEPLLGSCCISIPRDYLALRTRDLELASRWREAAAAAFERCFGAGLVATLLLHDAQYVFQPARELP